ncbi:MAG: hypothetical protein ACR2GY_03940 [Phycisphaerales bacterium]
MPEKKATTQERGSHDTDKKDAQQRDGQDTGQNMGGQQRDGQNAGGQRGAEGVQGQAAQRQEPTKPAPDRNPVGTSHNPAQGSPSTRRNPEAGKER